MKDVPGFSSVMVTEDGRVWSKKHERWMKPFKHHVVVGYYLRVSVKRDDGKWRPTSVHTLVCRAFHGLPPDDGFEYQVNHKDGNKTNNHYKNLEWASPQKNILHMWQMGLGGGNKSPIVYKDFVTGHVEEFESVVDMERSIGLPPDTGFRMLRKGLINGKTVVYSGDSFPEYSEEDIQKSVERYRRFHSTNFLARNYITGKTEEYSNIDDFFRRNHFTGILPQQIKVRNQTGSLWPINGFSFKKLSNDKSFLDFDEKQVEYSFNPKYRWGVAKEIVVKDLSTGLETRYGDRTSFAATIGVAESEVRWYIDKKDGYYKGYQIKYL